MCRMSKVPAATILRSEQGKAWFRIALQALRKPFRMLLSVVASSLNSSRRRTYFFSDPSSMKLATKSVWCEISRKEGHSLPRSAISKDSQKVRSLRSQRMLENEMLVRHIKFYPESHGESRTRDKCNLFLPAAFSVEAIALFCQMLEGPEEVRSTTCILILCSPSSLFVVQDL